jgi:uncharacterized protein YjbI with pentapeptide repeats
VVDSGMHRSSELVGEDPVFVQPQVACPRPVLILARPVRLQHLDKRQRQSDGPLSRTRLDFRCHDAAAVARWAVPGVPMPARLTGWASVLPVQSLHGPSDGHRASLEINVAPFEPKRFTLTQSECQRDDEPGAVPHISRRIQELSCLLHCELGGAAQFGGAEFSGEAQFGGAEFGKRAVFTGTRFGGVAEFDYVHFYGDAGFHRAQFGGATQFIGAKFGGKTWFERACFSGFGPFGGPQFYSVDFDFFAQFRGAQFGGDTNFGDAWFWKGAEFSGVRFRENAEFGEANFCGEAVFTGAQFGGEAQFGGVQFTGEVQFRGARAQPKCDHSGPAGWTIREAQLVEGEDDDWMYLVRVEGSIE